MSKGAAQTGSALLSSRITTVRYSPPPHWSRDVVRGPAHHARSAGFLWVARVTSPWARASGARICRCSVPPHVPCWPRSAATRLRLRSLLEAAATADYRSRSRIVFVGAGVEEVWRVAPWCFRSSGSRWWIFML